MNTLSELENDVRRYGIAFAAIERGRGTEEYSKSVDSAQRHRERLFASLAKMHDLAALKAQELQAEREALERLRDGEFVDDRLNERKKIDAKYYCATVVYYDILDAFINAAGLARIQEIKRLLGEGGEE